MESSAEPSQDARNGATEDHVGGAAGSEMGLKAREARRPVAEWTVTEVCMWLSGVPLGEEVSGLLEAANSHAIAGKALLRLTDGALQRMGVAPWRLRRALMHEVLRLRLREEMEDLLRITDE